MADFSLILDHPDSKEIIGKLVVGSTAKEVNQWLRLKYPDKNQSHLRLTQKVLKEFTDSQYTQYYDQMLDDKALLATDGPDHGHIRMSAALANNKFYRERMEEVANTELNMLKTCEMVATVLRTRMEQMYDLTQQDPTDVGRADNTFIRYVQLFVDTADKLEKMRANSVDHLADHNVTMQNLQGIIQMFQEVIRESFAEMDPDMANKVMERIYDRMNDMELPSAPTQEEKLRMTNNIEARVVSIENSID